MLVCGYFGVDVDVGVVIGVCCVGGEEGDVFGDVGYFV